MAISLRYLNDPTSAKVRFSRLLIHAQNSITRNVVKHLLDTGWPEDHDLPRPRFWAETEMRGKAHIRGGLCRDLGWFEATTVDIAPEFISLKVMVPIRWE